MVSSNNDDPKMEGLGVLRSNLNVLVARKENDDKQKITNKDIAAATGLDAHTIARWMNPAPLKRVESDAVRRLCKYLNCQLADLLYIDYSQN